MIFVEPPPKLTAALERWYRLEPGTDPFSKTGLRAALDAIEGKAIPATMPPLYFHAIESMARRPHIREIAGERVVIHDEEFADTVNFLEQTYIGAERPLVPWAVLARVFAEFLYIDARPDLGLYMADRVSAYASQFADADGRYARPIPFLDKYQPDTPAKKVLQDFLYRQEVKSWYAGLQRLLVLFHEIGHALYGIDQSWREVWQVLGSRVMDTFYPSAPVEFDSEYGLLQKQKMSREDIARINRKLLAKMVEEISCDWFALAGLVLNENSLNNSPELAIRCHWRFMLFTDLIEEVRSQARQRAHNKIRFRTVLTKLYVRTMAILSILKSPELIPRSKLFTDPNQIRGPLETIDVNKLVEECTQGVNMAATLMDLAVGGPATWERDLHYGSVPSGYLKPTLADGESLESRATLFDELFGDHFLRSHLEPTATRIAPCYRVAGHLLSRSRAWANDFFANEEAQQQYALMVEGEDSSFARRKLATAFEDILFSKAKREIVLIESLQSPGRTH